jgi:hypothetical protein
MSNQGMSESGKVKIATLAQYSCASLRFGLKQLADPLSEKKARRDSLHFLTLDVAFFQV